ncbi:MAG: molybdenum ABC transporter permease, partial [Bacteroidales bacterium]|nr:molybdenum ABC transporter permease [Bacteroidales bacterium]
MIKNSPFNWILLILSSLVLLFILAPLTGMFLHTEGSELLETVSDKDVQHSIWLTLWVSFAATFFFALGAVPLAWVLARKKFPL